MLIIIQTYLGKASSLDKVVEFPQRSVTWQTLNVFEQILFLELKQASVHVEVQWTVPERPDVHPRHLGCVEHLT